MRHLYWLVVACLLLGGGVGCSTIVRPPAALRDPQRVYLLDHITFSSLLLPLDEHRFVEYRFGDWAFGALDRHDPFHTVRAMLFSPQGGLGRRFLEFEPAPMLPVELNLRFLTVIPIDVERQDVTMLTARLDARFKAGKSHTTNPENGFDFATVSNHYSIVNNCNAFTQGELRELRCRVDRRSIFAWYDVEPAPQIRTGTPMKVEDQ